MAFRSGKFTVQLRGPERQKGQFAFQPNDSSFSDTRCQYRQFSSAKLTLDEKWQSFWRHAPPSIMNIHHGTCDRPELMWVTLWEVSCCAFAKPLERKKRTSVCRWGGGRIGRRSGWGGVFQQQIATGNLRDHKAADWETETVVCIRQS